MFGIVNFQGFLIAALLLNLTPGADTIYILTKSAAGGRKQGMASALGISGGIFFHTILAALGLSAILATSAAAFTVMKTLGAVYLLYMGLRTLRKKESMFSAEKQSEATAFKTFRQGVITNVLNPKVALFFLAFLPQYVSQGDVGNPVPFLILGSTFVITSTLWTLLIAYFSAFFAGFLNKNEQISRWTNRVTGCIYIGLGLNVLRAKNNN